MTSEPSSPLQQWITDSFDKLKTKAEFFPAYQRFILREIAKHPESNRLGFQEFRDLSADPDEPEGWTYAEYLRSEGSEFMEYFTESIDEGHLYPYAEAYGKERLNGSFELHVSAAAYEAIGANDQKWTVENPGYQDVLRACEAKGKDEAFAHRCAKNLSAREFSFKRAFEVTEEYEKNIAKALSQGRSATFSAAYAEGWNTFAQEVEEVSLNYAECFEKLLEANRPSDEADWIAKIYAMEFIEGYVDESDGNLEFEFDKDEALAQAESAYRFRDLSPEDKNLPSIFLRICRRKYPTTHSKQWFDEIETLARSVLSGETQLNDIPRTSYMELRETEAQLEEFQKPPRFSRMSEEDFKSFTSKSEEHHDFWEEEVRFREDCQKNGFDPTDPEERARYKEILSESGNAWWDGQDPDDRDGWIDNMNRP